MDKRMMILILAAISLLLIATIAIAAPEAYSISWWTVDSGGGTSEGGGYTLHGTIAQHDAGYLTGAEYKLGGGFWGGGQIVITNKTFLPLTLR